MLQKIQTLLIISLFPVIMFAQHTNYHLGNQFGQDISKQINISRNIIHTGFKPVMKSYVEPKIISDTVVYKTYPKYIDLFYKKMFSEDLFVVNKENINIYFNILMNFQQGNNKNDTKKYSQNTRGFEVYGDLGAKLSYYSSFHENQAFFVEYIEQKNLSTVVVPGQGSWKDFGENATGKDFGYASGYISFTPVKFFNIQLGHSKHFIGEGYRSLLLSDNSFNYPFAKFTFTYKKFQYTSMFTEFQEFETRYYKYHHKKHATFNYFSFSPHHKIQIGIFEGIIWKTSDDSTYTKKFNANYFNPIMLIRPMQFGMNDEHNILLGANIKISPIKYTELYGQFALDNIEFDKIGEGHGYFQNKFGYQVGAKIYDAFFGKINKITLYLQAEYNFVRPYTYSHDITRQNYSHYNQALAHPIGAGFKETILIANLNVYNFFFQFQHNNALTSADTTGTNYGSNIFLANETSTYGTSSFDNLIGQGNQTTIKNTFYTFGYIFNKTTYLQIFTTIQFRNYNNTIEKTDDTFIYLGIKTSLNNFYYDW